VRAAFGTNNVDTRRARVSERMMPGVVYPTFPPAGTGADVVTAEFADWATSCPAYKVTAVDIRRANRPSEWQKASLETRRETTGIVGSADAAE
jgi:formate dehydrogenase major subunit